MRHSHQSPKRSRVSADKKRQADLAQALSLAQALGNILSSGLNEVVKQAQHRQIQLDRQKPPQYIDLSFSVHDCGQVKHQSIERFVLNGGGLLHAPKCIPLGRDVYITVRQR